MRASWSSDTSGRDPEHPRRREWIYGPSFPPSRFISDAVVVPVMGSAERHRELVAHLVGRKLRLDDGLVGPSDVKFTPWSWSLWICERYAFSGDEVSKHGRRPGRAVLKQCSVP